MFRAELTCESCDFVSDSFVLGYHPPSDSVDIVFQSLVNSGFRVASCPRIARRLGSDAPSEHAIDVIVEGLVSEMKREDEEVVSLWVAPDEFAKRKCPKCNQRTVTLNLLSIV